MKPGIRRLCAVCALAASFLLGWRVMPRLWPGLRDRVLAPVFPQLKPASTAAPVPYAPAAHVDPAEEIAAEDSVIYYFYKDYCPFCAALEPLTAGLPEHVLLPDGTQSRVRLIPLNKVEEDKAAIIAAYYEEHGVPEDRRLVPAMVIGDRYLYLGEEIIGSLTDALLAGEGLNTPMLDRAARLP